MIRHFFLDKTNTIIEGNDFNLGLNPILTLSYGNSLMRGLLHFDMEQIDKLIKDKTFANTEKLKFTLKMTNCSSIEKMPYKQTLNQSERASSCSVMLFKLPCDFDAGRGFNFESDFWVENESSYSKDGSSWYFSKTMIPWNKTNNFDIKKMEGGIYPFNFLKQEYDKFKMGEESIIVGEQSFDFGDENLSIDITSYILECLKNGINNGLCLSFTPIYEMVRKSNPQQLTFFTDHTNTFFHPYIEAEYTEYIVDRRENFVAQNNDKLYLYVYNDGMLCNLDKLPVCTIEEENCVVKQATKGIYYAEISHLSNNVIEDSICYDKWSEIVLNEVNYDDIEMEFYINKKNKRISIGNNASVKNNVVPTVSGINDNESLLQGEIREVIVDFREKFSTNKKQLITTGEYRIYVKDGEKEIDIIKYHPIELANGNNYFLIHAADFVPNKYFVDIKLSTGRENMIFKKCLIFNVVNNITDYI